MKEVQLRFIPRNLAVVFSKSKVAVPVDIRAKIDRYWQELVGKNPKLYNGEVFTVISIKEAGDRMEVALAETDYAHYLYSHNVDGLGEYAVRVIHPTALVVTADDMLVFGAMGEHTSSPGVIQSCAGGIDHSDLREGVVDMQHAIAKELDEELGIHIDDTNRVESFSPKYIKSGGVNDKISVCYILRIKQTSDSFKHDYERFVERLREHSEEPEFGELFYLANNREAIEAFITEYSARLNEFMPVLLRAAHEDLIR